MKTLSKKSRKRSKPKLTQKKSQAKQTSKGQVRLLPLLNENSEMDKTRPKSPSLTDFSEEDNVKNNVRSKVDSFVSSLITEDLQELSPAIKSVFEQKKELDAVQSLELYIEARKTDIEKFSAKNYQKFFRSVDEVQKLKEESFRMKQNIIELNSSIQTTGLQLVSEMMEVVELRNISKNISDVKESIITVIKVLMLVKKMNTYILQEKYYPAIKIIEDLQALGLISIENYSFGVKIKEYIPFAKETILKRVDKSVVNWLTTIREKAPDIGQFALAQNHYEMLREAEFGDQRVILGYDPMIRLEDFIEIKMGSDTTYDITEVSVFYHLGEEFKFAPLYQCLYIYDCLDRGDEFKENYKKFRSKQAAWKDIEINEFWDNFRVYFWNIAGYFIIEHSVLKTSKDLINVEYKERLWNTGIVYILDLVEKCMRDFDYAPKKLLVLKNVLVVFSRTLKYYEYDTTLVNEFIFTTLKNRYLEVSSSVVHKLFIKHMRSDRFIPMNMHGSAHNNKYRTNIVELELDQLLTHKERKNQICPFSPLVPNCIRVLKNFISDSYRFVWTTVRIPEMDRHILDKFEFLIHCFCDDYVNIVEKYDALNIDIVTVAIVNIQYFASAMPFMDKHFAILGMNADAKIHYEEHFQEAEIALVDLMNSTIYHRIDSIFDKGSKNIHWLSSSVSDSTLGKDLLDFIQNSLSRLTAITSPTSGFMVNSFEYIANNFVQLLVNHEFNSNCARALSKDLDMIKSALKRAPDGKNYYEIMTEFEQILTLILNVIEDQNLFMDDRTRSTKYNHLTRWEILVDIFENYEEENTIIGRLFTSKKTKAIAQILRYMRSKV
eukprot:TRINITY_DN7247_c0_g1_i1.p1 TRINITY_DN7247_c0_g1~~TRINITY_DN7247_c0_g1_i1.p1  ORF type:complete len:832 (+),score=159.22 TRINITY_DN7247_c0_g1_i1:37-2532(+)